MYKIILSLLCILGYSCTAPKPDLVLSTNIYDFGILKTNHIYKGAVVIKNAGEGVLKIQEVDPDCSCTDVSITKKELSAGDTCLLKFVYNTHLKSGKYENYICITANTDSLVHILQINSLVDL